MQHFQYITLYYFNKGKNTTEMQKKICAVYGKVAVTDGMCQKRFVKFRVGDFSLDDAAWLGRPVEVDSDQIETLRTMTLFHVRDSQHPQTIQINTINGENENCVFYFKEKNI